MATPDLALPTSPRLLYILICVGPVDSGPIHAVFAMSALGRIAWPSLGLQLDSAHLCYTCVCLVAGLAEHRLL